MKRSTIQASASRLSETPEELAKRIDKLHLDLARIYIRIGRLIGVTPKLRRATYSRRLD